MRTFCDAFVNVFRFRFEDRFPEDMSWPTSACWRETPGFNRANTFSHIDRLFSRSFPRGIITPCIIIGTNKSAASPTPTLLNPDCATPTMVIGCEFKTMV